MPTIHRALVIPALVLATSLSLISCGHSSSDADLNHGEHEAVDNKPVNTVDPVTGDAVDSHIAAVAAKAHDGKDILIGVSSVDSAAKVKRNPQKYIDAALSNSKSEEK